MNTYTSDSLAVVGRRRTGPLEHVVAGGLAFGGLVLFAIAAGAIALRFVDGLSTVQAAQARALLGATPWVITLAVGHVAAALLGLSGRRARLVAASLEGVGAALAGLGIVLVASGHDPLAAFSSSPASVSSADGIGILGVLVVFYLVASLITIRSAGE